MTHAFTYTRRVEFADTDAAGVVHFSAFFRFMEEAEHAFYRSLGASGYRWEEDRVEGMPRASASCEYLRPVRYGEEVEVRLVVREKTAKSLSYEASFTVPGGDGGRREVARGRMRVVHTVRPHGSLEWRTTELPAVLLEKVGAAPAPD